MAEIPVQPTIPQSSTPKVAAPKPGIDWVKVLIGVVIGSALLGGGYLVYNAYFSNKTCCPPPPVTKTSTLSAKPATPSAKKDETAGWKVYSNSENRYSIKYPPTYTLVNLESPEHGSVSFRSKDYKLKGSNLLVLSNGVNITVSIGAPGSYINLDRYESSLIEESKKYNKKLINLAGETWRSFDYQGVQSSRSRIIFTLKDGRLYVINMDSTIEDRDPGLETYDLMLSTFKFLPSQ